MHSNKVNAIVLKKVGVITQNPKVSVLIALESNKNAY